MSILVRSDFESDKDWFDFLEWESLCKERDFNEEIEFSDSVFGVNLVSGGGSEDG